MGHLAASHRSRRDFARLLVHFPRLHPGGTGLAKHRPRFRCRHRLGREAGVLIDACERRVLPDLAREALMRHSLQTFLADESGQDLIEYALLAAFLSIVSVVILSTLGKTLSATYAKVNSAFN